MRNALQDQLLKAGLVKDKEVKEVQKQQRREERRTPPNKPDAAAQRANSARVQAEKAQAAKAERDRALNAEREARAARKALVAQVIQLIEPFRRPHNNGDEAYNFVDGSTVKRIYVTPETRSALARGELAILRIRTRYALVTLEGAEAVRARAPEFLVVQKTGESVADDAAYEEHPVPDDLMW
jgi:uncharacterized protein YaiL (DUF2058 family)